jgi:RES domain-containing protein
VRLWRISNYADLNGEGGRRRAGRWNSGGRAVVYLAEHPALALLENLVHLEGDPDDLPDTFQLLEVELSDATPRDQQTPAALEQANAGWRKDLRFTRACGDRWLAEMSTALFLVPSVILPKSTNALFNPAHPDAGSARIVDITRPAYDRRLFDPRMEAAAGRPSPTAPHFPK